MTKKWQHTIKLPISRELLRRSEIDGKNLAEQHKNSPSQIKMRDDNDFLGALGQNGVNDWLDNTGLPDETFPSFVEGVYRDICDYIFRGKRNDIKTSGFKPGYSPQIYKNTHFLVRDDYQDEAEKHGIQKYTFVRADPFGMQLHVAGVISRSRFKDICRVEPRALYPAHYVEAQWLDCFERFIYSVSCKHEVPEVRVHPSRYK
jgi:hypothetical protein